VGHRTPQICPPQKLINTDEKLRARGQHREDSDLRLALCHLDPGIAPPLHLIPLSHNLSISCSVLPPQHFGGAALILSSLCCVICVQLKGFPLWITRQESELMMGNTSIQCSEWLYLDDSPNTHTHTRTHTHTHTHTHTTHTHTTHTHTTHTHTHTTHIHTHTHTQIHEYTHTHTHTHIDTHNMHQLNPDRRLK
jgi:hypothetical protein